MWQQIIMGIIGLCAGFAIASGAVALVIGLGIIPRYAGVTKTPEHILWYEDCCMLGTILGTLAYLWKGSIPLGVPGLVLYGVFAGIVLGSWIIALGEVVDIFAILTRRIGLTRGLPWVILAMAAGKVLASLLYFAKGWW